MEKAYKYDAFISYRHVSPDKPIAERLQKLLETYVPPKGVRAEGEKKKLHLFRDETELPTSNDLGGDIRRALEDSRFLVVICSPEYEKSKWCMEEVRYFKELHGGSNRNILTILADDPDVRPAFPEALRFETVAETLENGETVTSEREIEPLAANVCAKTEGQMLKKLKSEFLRIAAPLLGCGYDDLYHREQRRATQRKLRFAFGTAAVLAVGVLLSTAALLTIRAKNQQIAADALELRKNNADLLLKESEMLEKDGDLYGALEAAVQAYPAEADGFDPASGTLMQLASLTGAYEPQSFAPVRKIGFSSVPNRLWLFAEGTRLAAVNNNCTQLVDTETGEIIKTLPDADVYKTAAYICPRVDPISITYYARGAGTQDENGLLEGFRKDLQQESPLEEGAFYALDESSETVARIDPATGEDLWRTDMPTPYGRIMTGALISNDGLPFISSSSGIALLDPDTGKTAAQISSEELTAAIGTGTVSDVFYAEERLIVTYKAEESLWFAVFGKEGETFALLYADVLLAGDTLASDTFMIRGDTLMAAVEYYPDSFSIATRFSGYDLAAKARKWEFESTDFSSGDPMIGYIEQDRGSSNPFPVAFAVNGDHMFVVNAENGSLISHTHLPGTAENVYYCERGIVFITLSSGYEVSAALRVFSGEDDSVTLMKNYEYSMEFYHAAYCGNVYAVCRKNETSVFIYRPVENEKKHAVFQNEEDDLRTLQGISFSPDRSASAILRAESANFSATAPHEISLVDLRTEEILHTITFEENVKDLFFIGNDHLAVRFSDRIEILRAETGASLQVFSEEEYDLDHFVCTADALLIPQAETGEILRAVPGEEPKSLTDLSFAKEGYAGEMQKVQVKRFGTSQAGDKLFLCLDVSVRDKKTHATNHYLRMAVYDTAAGETVACSLPEGDDFSQVFGNKDAACAFAADGRNVYLLLDQTLYGFSCETGETVCSAALDADTVDMVTIGNDPCVLTSDAVLIRLKVSDDTAAETGRISFKGRPTGGMLSYTPYENGFGVLRYIKHAWLINEADYATTAEINRFSSIDAENGVVYQNYYTMLYSYPLYGGADLLALAEERLGK